MKSSVELEFEALKWITGPLYLEERDEWLASVPDARARLLRYEQERDWRTSITAQILLGWLDHRSAYEGLLHDLDQADWEKAAKTIMGPESVWQGYSYRAREDPDFRKMVFPLCVEVVLKRHREWRYQKTRTFFEMLRQMQDERAIEPIFWYLQNVAQDKNERDDGALMLRLYPTEPLRTRVARLHADQTAVFEALQSELDDRHLPAKR